jgi:hypothetical protein
VKAFLFSFLQDFRLIDYGMGGSGYNL